MIAGAHTGAPLHLYLSGLKAFVGADLCVRPQLRYCFFAEYVFENNLFAVEPSIMIVVFLGGLASPPLQGVFCFFSSLSAV